jgi:hypothetical protein
MSGSGYDAGRTRELRYSRRADEKHGDLFLPLLSNYIADQQSALKAADDALELFKLYHLGVAEEMEKLD